MRVNKQIIIEVMHRHIFVWGQVRGNNLAVDKEPLRAVNEPVRLVSENAGFHHFTH